MREKPNSTTNTIFDLRYALLNYELISAKPHHPYREAADILIKCRGKLHDDAVALDLGCGTGNSTIEILTAHPNIGKMYGVDPSLDFLGLAKYKFGQSPFPESEGIEIPLEVAAYIEEQRVRASKFTTSTHFIPGKSQSLPLPDSSINEVFGVQSFHWFTFADNDPKGVNRNYLEVALKEISRVLKPGAKYTFDTSGLQFDFGTDEEDGTLVNNLHLMNHPFHLAFLDCFNKIITEQGFTEEASIKTNRMDKYHHILDWSFLERVMAKYHLRPVPLTKNQPYLTTFSWKDAKNLEDTIRLGAQMRCFSSPPLNALESERKGEIVRQTMERVLADHSRLLSLPAAEILVAFSFEKI